jgi:hypothetical protein
VPERDIFAARGSHLRERLVETSQYEAISGAVLRLLKSLLFSPDLVPPRPLTILLEAGGAYC